MLVPFFSLHPIHQPLRSGLLAAMEEVLDSGWLVLGNTVEQFETAWAAACQVPHAVGVGNGLDALTLALRALGVGLGDEVIVPANTYIATWLAVTHVGATVVPVEPDPLTFNLNPEAVRAAITPRTRLLLPVHLFGQPADMTALSAIAARHQLSVLEDNAQAAGATWEGRPTGSLGHAAAHSFYPTKNLGALGDAGAVTTSDNALADQLRRIRNYGSTQKYQHEIVGWNSRLDELQAAILLKKLPYLAGWNAVRAAIAAYYSEQLAALAPELTLPVVAPGAMPVWHQYVVRTKQRDALQAYLTAQGIGTLIHYPLPPHRQPAYAHLGLREGQFPISEAMAATSLSLPIWPGLTPEQLTAVVTAVRGFFGVSA
jgi:dTDP-4-amino-4,6-dideoxygalactose transaminase